MADATVFITHRVRDDRHADYERWADEIAPLSKAAPGHLGRHVVRPVPGIAEAYTVVIRFDTRAHLQEWMSSPVRKRLIEKVQPLLAGGEDFFINSARAPARWKQYLVTWSAIYPLVVGVTLLVTSMLRQLGIPNHYWLTTLVVTGIVVFLMISFVMPLYTKLIHRWLFT